MGANTETPTSGIVTQNREAWQRFATYASSSASPLRESMDSSRGMVGERWGQHTLAASGPLGSATIMFVPPLADATGKAERTLSQCLESGDPIEDHHDQSSVAFWSNTTSELRLYRDWRGSPPIYYYIDGSTLLWSTSIRELLQLGVARVPDKLALAQLQRVGYVPAPRTMVEGIKKIPPGHILSFGPDGPVTHRHWSPPFTPKHRDPTKKRAGVVRAILAEAIESMAARSGPTAVLLSGGIDSVAVLAIASRVVGLDLAAFTYRYEDYTGRYNEGPIARAAANSLGVEHTEIPIGPSFVTENLPRLLRAYEEPMTYGLHSSRMEPIADEGIGVALSGADAPFLNMPSPMAWALRTEAVVPRPLLDTGRRLTGRSSAGPLHRANTLLSMAQAGIARQYLEFPLHKVVPETLASTLYRDPDLHAQALTEMEEELSETAAVPDGLTPRDRLVLLGLTGSAAEHVLTWNHRWGLLAGISVRFPLCDDDFVAYMSRKTMGTPGKEDLRTLAGEFLPEEVVATPKVPQTIPLDEWFRGPLQPYLREQLSRDAVVAEGTFVPEVIERCLDEHVAGHANHKWVLWSSLTYLLWRRHVLEN